MSRHQSAGQNNNNIKTANKSFGTLANLKYLETVTNKNYYHDEIKSK
jgi:hypothetical protein